MRILLVDDEELSRRGLRALIEREISDVQIIGEASDGQAALEAVESLQPDLVLMDIRMPEMDGVEAASRIAETAPGTRIVFLSAYDEFEYAQEAVRIGADGYLLKPVDRQELTRVLRESSRRLAERRRLDAFDQRTEVERVRRWASEQLVHAIIQGQEQHFQELAEFLPGVEGQGTLLVVEYPEACDPCLNYLERTLGRERVAYALRRGDRTGVFFLPGVEPREIAHQAHRKSDSYSEVPCRIRAAAIDAVGRGSHRAYRRLLAAMATEAPVEVVSQPVEGYRGSSLQPVVVPDMRARVEEVVAERAAEERLELIGKLLEEVEAASSESTVIRELLVELVVCFRTQALALVSGETGGFENGYIEELWNAASIPEMSAVARRQILRYEQALREIHAGRYSWRLTRAVDFLLEHLGDDLYLDVVAEQVGISPQHLSRLFKEEMNSTFTRFVNEQRIERARYLLLTTSLGVAEIATAAGYRDADYFSRVFRRFCGCSPSDYRNAVGTVSL